MSKDNKEDNIEQKQPDVDVDMLYKGLKDGTNIIVDKKEHEFLISYFADTIDVIEKMEKHTDEEDSEEECDCEVCQSADVSDDPFVYMYFSDNLNGIFYNMKMPVSITDQQIDKILEEE